MNSFRVGLLGSMVKTHREHKNLSQEQVAKDCGVSTSRTGVAHLEQGLRLPKPEVLSAICQHLDIPKPQWEPFTQQESLLRFNFEESLSEFVGRSVNLDMHDDAAQKTAETLISEAFSSNPSPEQLLDTFNSILVYYGVGPISESFFCRYFDPSAFGSRTAFSDAIERYQMDAIRLFATFAEAFETLNSAKDIEAVLRPIQPHSVTAYQARTEWNLIERIDDELLPDLGYISAQRVRQEAAERDWLIIQLRSLANSMRSEGPTAIEALTSKNSRKIDSLLSVRPEKS